MIESIGTFIVVTIVSFFAWFIVVPVLLALVRMFGLYAIVEEGQCHVYILFGKVVGVLQEPGFYFLPRKFLRRSLIEIPSIILISVASGPPALGELGA